MGPLPVASGTASRDWLRCDPGQDMTCAVGVRVVGWRRPFTLARPVELTGRGLLFGRRVRVRFLPADTGTGRLFVRTDRPGAPTIPAIAEAVTSTLRRTVLGTPPDHVELVEHVLAALAGLLIDNCCIELDGPEPPGWDGSVRELVSALKEAGLAIQDQFLPIVTPSQVLDLRHGASRLVLLPAEMRHLEMAYFLDYGVWSAVGPQRFSYRGTPQDFVNRLAASRTFLLLEEVQALRQQGIGIHTGPEQVLVFGRQGVLANRLRWADEPARHKTLDLVGDLALVGCPLAGQVVAYRSGHTLNVALAQRLRPAVSKVLLSAATSAVLSAA
ncbi:UDP-3-O-acyl-N-acetylglucosamine deacetylase [bacterium HR36]|nr:UDP-3-O-acyl-N-acetylglucosamine deacetylase [bacterium HR36]